MYTDGVITLEPAKACEEAGELSYWLDGAHSCYSGYQIEALNTLKALSHEARCDAHPKRIELNAHWMRIDRVHMA